MHRKEVYEDTNNLENEKYKQNTGDLILAFLGVHYKFNSNTDFDGKLLESLITNDFGDYIQESIDISETKELYKKHFLEQQTKHLLDITRKDGETVFLNVYSFLNKERKELRKERFGRNGIQSPEFIDIVRILVGSSKLVKINRIKKANELFTAVYTGKELQTEDRNHIEKVHNMGRGVFLDNAQTNAVKLKSLIDHFKEAYPDVEDIEQKAVDISNMLMDSAVTGDMLPRVFALILIYINISQHSNISTSQKDISDLKSKLKEIKELNFRLENPEERIKENLKKFEDNHNTILEDMQTINLDISKKRHDIPKDITRKIIRDVKKSVDTSIENMQIQKTKIDTNKILWEKIVSFIKKDMEDTKLEQNLPNLEETLSLGSIDLANLSYKKTMETINLLCEKIDIEPANIEDFY